MRRPDKRGIGVMDRTLFCGAALLLAMYVCAAEPPSDLGWTGVWTFDGALADSAGALDAVAEKPEFVPAGGGQALRLDAGAAIPDSPEVRLAPGFRLACRMRFNALAEGNAWTTVLIKGGYGAGEYILRVDPASEGGRLSFFVNTGTWEPRVRSRAAVRTGEWYEVEAGWDGRELWLTVNGDTTRERRAGAAASGSDPVKLGACDAELDALRIFSPAAAQAGEAYWPLDGDLRDATGRGHTVKAQGTAAFAPGRGGQALRADSASLSVASAPDLQLAPGLRLDCAFRFDEVPANITPLVVKDGEYMLRLDSRNEGGHLAFFVMLNGRWEPRLRSDCRVVAGVWYRVAARWDGLALTLDVNGERTELVRSGQPTPGDKPLTFGRFKGLLARVRVENPKPAVVRLRNVETVSTLLRAGRSERLIATVQNFAEAIDTCSVTLQLPPGVVCESPAEISVGTIPACGERQLSWVVRAETAQSALAAFRLTAKGLDPIVSHKTLAFLAQQDPDLSARAWNPPGAAPGAAATYYVDSARGDNANAGTSPETAWRDFTPVNGRTLGPGERLLLRRGSVINQELSLTAKASAEAWAEIGTYGEGPRPVIRRNGDIDDRCVLITSPDYLRIRGLTVCYAGKGLIVYYGQSGHRGLLIEDCIAHHIEGLYRFNAHGIPEWRDRRGAPGGGGASGGIAASASGEDIVFRDCEMFHCSSGFRFAGRNVYIDRVFCHDNFVHNTSPHPFLTSVSRAYLLNSIFDASGWHAHAGTMGIMLGGQYGLIIRNCHFLSQPDSGSHDEGGIDFEAGGEGCLIDRCTFRNNAGAAIEMLGLRTPQAKNVEIANSRFDRNNVALKLGPSEIFIWGGSKDPVVCCSSGLIHDNGFVLNPGVLFFTNQAPETTRWTLTNNTRYATAKALDKALPLNNPPGVDAGTEIWSDSTDVRLKGKVSDDRKPATGRLATLWEVLDGPGEVRFSDASKPSARASFSRPGDYGLRLKADDGELWRSAHTVVHVLPAGTAVARAWGFSRPLDKEGWSEWAPGTRDEAFVGQKWECIARPVRMVAGGCFVIALQDSVAAHLLSPDGLGVDCGDNPVVTIRMQNHTSATRMRLRFTTDEAPSWGAGLGKVFETVAQDPGQRLYAVDMRDAVGWSGKLKQLQLEFSDGEPVTGTCRIDYIWVGRRGG